MLYIQFFYLFICWWTLTLFPHFGQCQSCCLEHTSSKSWFFLNNISEMKFLCYTVVLVLFFFWGMFRLFSTAVHHFALPSTQCNSSNVFTFSQLYLHLLIVFTFFWWSVIYSIFSYTWWPFACLHEEICIQFLCLFFRRLLVYLLLSRKYSVHILDISRLYHICTFQVFFLCHKMSLHSVVFFLCAEAF